MSIATKTPVPTLESILCDVYGVGVLAAEACTVEWAVDRLAKEIGPEKAARAWKKLNDLRNRRGVYTTIPQWGSPYWTPYFRR